MQVPIRMLKPDCPRAPRPEDASSGPKRVFHRRKGTLDDAKGLETPTDNPA